MFVLLFQDIFLMFHLFFKMYQSFSRFYSAGWNPADPNQLKVSRALTLEVEGQVLGSIRTLKHQRLLDLLHQLVEEVLPGGVLVQQAAGPVLVSEPGREQQASVRRWNRSSGIRVEMFSSIT